MKKKAIFAGSFDPFTNGHLDILERTAGLFDSICVTVAINPDKKCMFDERERLEMIEKTLMSRPDLCNVTSCVWRGYLFELCKQIGAGYIVKGLRNPTDFEYEKILTLKTRELCPEVETFFCLPSEKYASLSSTDVRHLIENGKMPYGYVPDAQNGIIKSKVEFYLKNS